MFRALRGFRARRKSLLARILDDASGHPWILEDVVLHDWYWTRDDQLWADAIDDLQSWPLPPDIAKSLRSAANNDDPTLLHFLSSFLSSPTQVELKIVPEINLALFAGARVIAPLSPHVGLSASRPWSEIIHSRMIGRLGEAVWVWLVDQLPRRVFAPDLERAIAGMSGLIAA
jgi:hypothetical protein